MGFDGNRTVSGRQLARDSRHDYETSIVHLSERADKRPLDNAIISFPRRS